MPQITFAQYSFKTKKALVERIRSIIADYPDNILVDDDDCNFLSALIERHPESLAKKGCGIKGFYVSRNPLFPGEKQRGFRIIRIDNTETDFSFWECVTPSSHEKKVKKAFRNAIQNQLLEFKQNFFDNVDAPICPVTGHVMEFTGSHVDHVHPRTFERLLLDFLNAQKIRINSVVLDDHGDNQYFDDLADKNLAHQWQMFHQSQARLEVISQVANLSHRKKR